MKSGSDLEFPVQAGRNQLVSTSEAPSYTMLLYTSRPFLTEAFHCIKHSATPMPLRSQLRNTCRITDWNCNNTSPPTSTWDDLRLALGFVTPELEALRGLHC